MSDSSRNEKIKKALGLEWRSGNPERNEKGDSSAEGASWNRLGMSPVDLHSDPSRKDYKDKHPGGSSGPGDTAHEENYWKGTDPRMREHEERRFRKGFEHLIRLRMQRDKRIDGYPGGLPEETLMALDSITLWTNGSVDTVRDPELFNSALSSPVENDAFATFDNESYWTYKPARSDYDVAHAIMRSFAKRPVDPEVMDFATVYRGMHGPKKKLGAFLELAQGNEFDLNSISSWSTTQSETFNTPTYGGDIDVRMKMRFPKFGTYIGELSHFRDEQEFVTTGRVRVVKVERVDNASGGADVTLEVEHVL